MIALTGEISSSAEIVSLFHAYTDMKDLQNFSFQGKSGRFLGRTGWRLTGLDGGRTAYTLTVHMTYIHVKNIILYRNKQLLINILFE